jgi:hypothetical protein
LYKGMSLPQIETFSTLIKISSSLGLGIGRSTSSYEDWASRLINAFIIFGSGVDQ